MDGQGLEAFYGTTEGRRREISRLGIDDQRGQIEKINNEKNCHQKEELSGQDFAHLYSV